MVEFYNIQDMLSTFYKSKDDNIITKSLGLDTPGTRNPIFGAQAFTQFNTDAKFWNCLPKKPWRESGFRLRVSEDKDGKDVTVASDDGGNLPDDVLSDIREVVIPPKIVSTRFIVKFMKNLIRNDNDYTSEQEAKAKGIDHIAGINKMLLRSADAGAGNATEDAKKFETLDRIASNQTEGALLSAVTYLNLYGLDRAGSGTYDCGYVDAKADSGSTDRTLTKEMIKSLITGIEEASGKRPNVILTGMDTADHIDFLFAEEVRTKIQRVSYGLNGIQTAKGNDIGFEVAKIYDIVVIRDRHVIKDGSSRIYAFNTEFLSFWTALPTDFRTGKDIFANNGLNEQGIYITCGQLVCNNFKTVGKIRDLA